MCRARSIVRGLATYLWNGVVIGPRTLIESVSLLPAGGTGDVVWRRRATERAAALLALAGARARTRMPTARGADLSSALEEAVRIRLIRGRARRIFLSGGTTRARSPRSPRAPPARDAISFDEAGYDESAYARAVATALGTEHQEVRLSGDSSAAARAGARQPDQPTFDAINTYSSAGVREAA